MAMSIPFKRTALALVVLAGVAPLAAAAAEPAFVAGRVLMKPLAGLSEEKIDKLAEKVGGKKGARKLRGLEVRVLEVPEGAEVKVANALSHNPHVAFAEPDWWLPPTVVTVNDPKFAGQWHLAKMAVPTAWDAANGKGVTVAVCDTGVDTSHPDLAGQVIPGWNTAQNSADVSDVHGHGTNVSGVIAEVANNGIGGASVAPGARVLAMRISADSSGYASASAMADCVVWAADHGARVANISYSGAAGSSTVANAGTYMMNKGGLVVVAAANDAKLLPYGDYKSLFVAGATDRNDVKASFSNWGDFVDITAPGVDIYTTAKGGGYLWCWGTSFSTPNTAATAALVMSANPALTPTDVTSIITNTAKDLGAAGWDQYYGHGRVDAGAAVTLAASAQPSDFTPPDVAVSTPSSGATVKDLVTVDVQATDAFGVMAVDFFIDGSLVATEGDPVSGSTYRFAWDSKSVSDGPHRLTARAKDAANNTGISQDVTVNVANNDDVAPPTFTSRTPASGAVVSGVMTMSASASDNVAVANVSISGGGVSCSGTTSASCNLNTRKIPGGTTIQVTFTATDTAGNTATEQSSVVVCCAATDTTTTDTTTTDPTPKLPPGLEKKK